MSNVKIEIKVKNIIENCKIIRTKIFNKSKIYFVAKSNVYGFGLELIQYIINYIDGIVFKDFFEYGNFVKCFGNVKIDIIILYPYFVNYNDVESRRILEEKNVFFVANSIDDLSKALKNNLSSRYFVRIDLFLGMHGIEFEQLEIDKLRYFKGILVHINENLSEAERGRLLNVINLANKFNIKINLGGSTILKESDLFKYSLDIRISKEILFSKMYNEISSMTLFVRILEQKIVQKETYIGYKSDRVCINRGTILLVMIGYGEFKILNLLYEKKFAFDICGQKFILACYPCMNTSWFYSENIVEIEDAFISLFDYKTGIQKISQHLDIDEDEVITSFAENLYREYIL